MLDNVIHSLAFLGSSRIGRVIFAGRTDCRGLGIDLALGPDLEQHGWASVARAIPRQGTGAR